jgi:excisionase family DNA binding protein
MEKRFLGLKELAQYIGVKEGTLYVWVCYRKIPYIKVGRLLKFDLHKIEKWLEERTTEVYN